MITIESLAKVILSMRKDISNKKLQKLAYYVYCWYLTIYNEKIADINFEAWEHGPVSRQLYNKYKQYGWNIIPQYKGFVLASDEKIRFISKVVQYYGKYDADTLEEMTHREKPWQKARGDAQPNEASEAIIDDTVIIVYYMSCKDTRKKIFG